jgi:hypothetical protein
MVQPVNFPEMGALVPEWWPQWICVFCKQTADATVIEITYAETSEQTQNGTIAHSVFTVRKAGPFPVGWAETYIGKANIPTCPDCIKKFGGS